MPGRVKNAQYQPDVFYTCPRMFFLFSIQYSGLNQNLYITYLKTSYNVSTKILYQHISRIILSNVSVMKYYEPQKF